MRRSAAMDEIRAAGSEPVEVRAFLRFKVGRTTMSFFPNHYENMRRGEVEAFVRNCVQLQRLVTGAPRLNLRRRPRDA